MHAKRPPRSAAPSKRTQHRVDRAARKSALDPADADGNTNAAIAAELRLPWTVRKWKNSTLKTADRREERAGAVAAHRVHS